MHSEHCCDDCQEAAADYIDKSNLARHYRAKLAEAVGLLESAVSCWWFMTNDPSVPGGERKAAERLTERTRAFLAGLEEG